MVNIVSLVGLIVSDRERYRRAIIRVVTSLLNLIIGPSGAWIALGMNGIFGYIFIHTITRWLVAEGVSKNETISKKGYRLSPLLLFCAGIIPFFWSNWESYVVAVPLLLGTFEGAYWSAFHGFRKSATKSADAEAERKSVRIFQIVEVISTITAAGFVILLKYQDLVDYGGYMGAVLALIAIIIPMNEGASEASIGFSTSETWSEKAVRGRIPTSSLGTISYLSQWSMRIISLQTGGIALLGGMVAASKLIGFIISEYNESHETDEDADTANWKTGNYFALVGIIVMILSLFYSQEKIFLIAYLVCTCGTSGILYPLEVRIAGELLSGKGGNIGLRERIKFATQAKILLFYLGLSAPIITYLEKTPEVEILLVPGLILSAMCCILNLHSIDVMKIHRLA